ncbi:hypothetical protein NWE59_04300 [Mycoplasmopsis felis]|uniref:hypothetical protein n=1 Tax=Mycoplasmopsis felis TaxID=33923 RepID=UPI0021AFBCDD|nr:hypothetical protein [Mycoplasmopsis felis]UWV78149.1 hypothetical protein NWE59_04300 [Mycoplasmopsis felis]
MDIYQEKENEIRLKNKKDILLNLSEYEEKIKKYAKRFNYDFDYLVQMINENEFLLNDTEEKKRVKKLQAKCLCFFCFL